ncbi:hypothetical protein BV898_04581 [Hypsibius exemplaris]|uniref:Uncharacterized protein n=1 Tax=Hypsibius exemplaris TaxID=2072580 RepID=A0A1W0X232_HYPEX|nr:hypothetical protein BV898_04581 [Hypsibius exemplaris]
MVFAAKIKSISQILRMKSRVAANHNTFSGPKTLIHHADMPESMPLDFCAICKLASSSLISKRSLICLNSSLRSHSGIYAFGALAGGLASVQRVFTTWSSCFRRWQPSL